MAVLAELSHSTFGRCIRAPHESLRTEDAFAVFRQRALYRFEIYKSEIKKSTIKPIGLKNPLRKAKKPWRAIK